MAVVVLKKTSDFKSHDFYGVFLITGLTTPAIYNEYHSLERIK